MMPTEFTPTLSALCRVAGGGVAAMPVRPASQSSLSIMVTSCPSAGRSLIGRLLLFNALDMKFRELKLRRDPACPLCGENPSITKLIDYEVFCGIPTEPVNPAVNPDDSLWRGCRGLDW